GCIPWPLHRLIAHVGGISRWAEPDALARVSDRQCQWWRHLGRSVRRRWLLLRQSPASASPRCSSCRVGARAGWLFWMWLLDPALRRSTCSIAGTGITRTACGCCRGKKIVGLADVPFSTKRGLSHEMQQAVVCRRLSPPHGASVVEYWNTQCARRRSCFSCLRGRSDG